LTQTLVFRASGAGGFVNFGTFLGRSLLTLRTTTGQQAGSGGSQIVFPNVAVRSYPLNFSFLPVGGAGITIQIFNNGNLIFSRATPAGGRQGVTVNEELVVDELAETELDKPENIPFDEEEAFVFANIFSPSGRLISSGKISQANLDVLVASGHTFEIITEGEVDPPDVPVDPQNPFIVIDGENVPLNKTELDPRIKTIEAIIFEEQSKPNAIKIILTEELSLIDNT